MRFIVAILIGLTLLKFYAQNQIVTAAISDVLVKAYQARAADVCNRNKIAAAPNSKSPAWTARSPIEVQVGRQDMAAKIWQFDHILWNAAHRRVYLVLDPSAANASLSCAYDVASDTAQIISGQKTTAN